MTENARRAYPKTYARIDFEAPFDGWWCEVRTNVEWAVYEELQSEDYRRVLAALTQICGDSNFVDARGDPVDARTVDGLKRIGPDLTKLVITGYAAAMRRPLATRSEERSSVPSSPTTVASSLDGMPSSASASATT